jgi:hypothetical protein
MPNERSEPCVETHAPDFYPIREELIADYVAAGRTDLLLSLFNWMKSARDRAERVATIYQQELHRLREREQQHGTIATPVSRPKAAASKPTSPAPPETIDLDELL